MERWFSNTGIFHLSSMMCTQNTVCSTSHKILYDARKKQSRSNFLKKTRPKTICKKQFEMINNAKVDCIPDLCLEEMLTIDIEDGKGSLSF